VTKTPDVSLTQLLGYGKPKAKQLDLGSIFHFEQALKQRGLRLCSESHVGETLISATASGFFACDDVKSLRTEAVKFLKRFVSKNFRITTRKQIFDGSTPAESDQDYAFEQTSDNEQRYGRTFELLVAYLAVEQLGALSAGFGVKVEGAPSGGDFDCIASFRDMIVYAEVKSGETLNGGHFKNFLDRHSFLHADLSLLLVDGPVNTEAVNLALGQKVYDLYKVDTIRELSNARHKFHTLEPNVLVVDLHKNGDILRNLRGALRYFWGYKALAARESYALIDPVALGFKVKPPVE
jgi:hypothetical protein